MSSRSAGGSKWSLEPTQGLLEVLGHPEQHLQFIHVGGSNGKGSVAAMIAAALQKAGFRVGLYTSPHLVDVRERMLVDGQPISRSAFTAWTNRIRLGVEDYGASFFEATTAIALADFAARQVEIAVVEVGLGGRLDATNVITPLVSAVTNVSFDHTEYLGSSLRAIAYEKAGIAKPDTPFVIGETEGERVKALEEYGRQHNAQVVLVPPQERYEGALGLVGATQRRNACVARAVLDALPQPYRVGPDTMAAGFAEAWLAGRFDRRGPWLFDVAHNEAAITTLSREIAATELAQPVHALFFALEDKAWSTMLETLSSVVSRLWVTVAPSAPVNRRPSEASIRRAVPPGAVVEPEFDRALHDVRTGAGSIVVTGSFHTVGDAMSRLPGFLPLG